ncbi:MAG: LptF/LptG family permease [Spirochaetia bacterium]|nr:LptF/LptG family permease [Spirochaetia bacterium]
MFLKRLDVYIIKQFIFLFLLTLSSASIIVSLVDIFGKIDLFISQEVPFGTIAHLFVSYIPYSITLTLPAVLLFSICFLFANLYANNEIIAILNSGISFYRLTAVIITIGFLLSITSFLFDNFITIPSNQIHDNIIENISETEESNLNNTDFAIWNNDFSILYFAEYYDASAYELTNLSIIIFENGVISERVDAKKAQYDEERGLWIIKDSIVFSINNTANASDSTEGAEKRGKIASQFKKEYVNTKLTLAPDNFLRISDSIKYLQFSDAVSYIQRIRYIDRDTYYSASTDLYERIFFSLTPIIVTLLSLSIGTRMKKNILLLSIFYSLSILVVFYVVEFIGITLAKQGYIHPSLGSLLPFTLFFIIGSVMYKNART